MAKFQTWPVLFHFRSLNIFKYISFIIKYNFKLWSIFSSFFLAPKNGEITTDECAVLLKIEDGIKEKNGGFFFFLIPYPNLQKNRLVSEVFERKKEEEKSDLF